MKRIVIFASGTGTTFNSIVEYAKENGSYSIVSLVSNKMDCGAVQIAKREKIDVIEYDENIVDKLASIKPDLIVLAGFLKILRHEIIHEYSGKIINIHPSLLPSFGGRGFYGIRVHRAVKESGVKFTGFTVHRVTEDVDGGEILYQMVTPVLDSDTPEDIERRVHKMELEYFPSMIESLLKGN